MWRWRCTPERARLLFSCCVVRWMEEGGACAEGVERPSSPLRTETLVGVRDMPRREGLMETGGATLFSSTDPEPGFRAYSDEDVRLSSSTPRTHTIPIPIEGSSRRQHALRGDSDTGTVMERDVLDAPQPLAHSWQAGSSLESSHSDRVLLVGQWLKWKGLPALHTRIPRRMGLGMDVGGTLTKIVYFEPDELLCCDGQHQQDCECVQSAKLRAFLDQSDKYGETGQRDSDLQFRSSLLRGHFHFLRFDTRRMENFHSIIKANKLLTRTRVIYASGGGAYKFAKDFKRELGIEIHKTDELQSLISGITLLLQYYKNELYYYSDPQAAKSCLDEEPAVEPASFTYEQSTPFLLVNIGSGISILRVNSIDNYERVGGSSIGGGTFLGLCSLLTPATTFQEGLELARRGDSNKVDMLVSDIYGGDYERFGLDGDTVASSFGLMMRPEKRAQARPEDLAKALLVTITNNIGSVSYMLAKAQNLDRVIYVGNFMKGNDLSKRFLSYAMNFWSKGTRRAYFIRHEGYLGACGALVENWNGLTAGGFA